MYVGLEHITSEGEFTEVPAVENGELSSNKFAFNSSHVLYGKLRPYLKKIAIPDFEGICSTDILPVKPGPELDRRYLFYFLRQPRMIDLATSLAVGINLPRLSPKQLLRFEIPLPPLPEQRRIAAILDKADELRRKRRRAIQRLDDLLQSVFLEMFGDPVTNPKGWEVGSIDHLVKNKSDVKCGPFGTQLKVAEIVEAGVPLFGIENVQNNLFNPSTSKFLTTEKAKQLQKYDVRDGDVLVTRMGTIGRACVATGIQGEARLSYHLFRVRPDTKRCLPIFLATTICRSGTFQGQLRQMAHGAIMSGLSTKNLREVKFLLPPLPLQRKYVEYVKTVESQMTIHNQHFMKTEILFSSLQQHAFI